MLKYIKLEWLGFIIVIVAITVDASMRHKSIDGQFSMLIPSLVIGFLISFIGLVIRKTKYGKDKRHS
jgi:hypothetical protein